MQLNLQISALDDAMIEEEIETANVPRSKPTRIGRGRGRGRGRGSRRRGRGRRRETGRPSPYPQEQTTTISSIQSSPVSELTYPSSHPVYSHPATAVHPVYSLPIQQAAPVNPNFGYSQSPRSSYTAPRSPYAEYVYPHILQNRSANSIPNSYSYPTDVSQTTALYDVFTTEEKTQQPYHNLHVSYPEEYNYPMTKPEPLQEYSEYHQSQQTVAKNTLCRFFLKGTCTKGERCQFSHEYSNSNSVFCKFYNSPGGCNRGDYCNFRHETQKAEKENSDSEYSICWDFNTEYGCFKGTNCRWLHKMCSASRPHPYEPQIICDPKYAAIHLKKEVQSNTTVV